MISWIKIDKTTDLPNEEVIALEEESQEIVIGFLMYTGDGMLVCDEEASYLEEPTHYILKSELTKLVT